MARLPPVKNLRAFLLADIDVGEDLLELLARSLRAQHRVRRERIALIDRLYARQNLLHEPVVDRFLNQRARRAGADFALVEREQDEAFNRFIEERVVFGHAHLRRRYWGSCRPAQA